MDLKGKSALITGSSRGIGREVALRFARDGAKVVVNGVASRDKAEAVASEIRALGGEAAVVLADVSKRGDAAISQIGRPRDICNRGASNANGARRD